MRLNTWWREVRHSLMKTAATITARRVAETALDDLEEAMLGEKGAAEEILNTQQSTDPLTRIRAAHGITPDDDTQPRDPKDPSDAQAELDRLKKKHAKN